MGRQTTEDPWMAVPAWIEVTDYLTMTVTTKRPGMADEVRPIVDKPRSLGDHLSALAATVTIPDDD